ncbi:MAG: hypothetical protein RIM23_09970 [Coleofasciculus sp. G3-WIS-01]|uniref:hypothetical protein n=1 Tax=Coleofasciculus sp. G3-WIS-01 TaxID=3069528 RepID=UPI003302BEE3
MDNCIIGDVTLTDQELLYLFRIGNLNKPAGIIDNSSNEVLVRNRASVLQLNEWKTRISHTTSLWQKGVLNDLRADIFKVKDGEGFNREYQLSVPNVGLIFLQEHFTRITFKGSVCRVFEQIDCRIAKS